MHLKTEGRGSRHILYCQLTNVELPWRTECFEHYIAHTWQRSSYRHGPLPALYIIRSSANHRQVLPEETTELYGFSITDTRKLRNQNTSRILAQILVSPAPQQHNSTTYSTYSS